MIIIAKTKTLMIRTIFYHPYLKEFWVFFGFDVSSIEISKTSPGMRAADMDIKIIDTIAKLISRRN